MLVNTHNLKKIINKILSDTLFIVWSDCRHNCEEFMLNLYYDCFENVLLYGIISFRGNKLKSIEHTNLFYRKNHRMCIYVVGLYLVRKSK